MQEIDRVWCRHFTVWKFALRLERQLQFHR
jgi:hypothetical protein